jgi:hypothetical protein
MSDSAIAQRLMQEWLQAATDSNLEWFRDNLLPEFTYLNAGGGRMDKEGIMAANAVARTSYKLHDVEAHRLGDVLVAIGRYTGTGVIPREVPVSDDMRNRYLKGAELQYSQVWVERNGRLRCLLLQTTPIT